jgi:AAA15 family ATPase/GTPase
MFTRLYLEDFRIFKDQTIHIGNTITAIAGHNATGKSTILGILGNTCELKSKFGTTITDKQFKTEFSELFKGSKAFDKVEISVLFFTSHKIMITRFLLLYVSLGKNGIRILLIVTVLEFFQNGLITP